jgi:hypothetical protein
MSWDPRAPRNYKNEWQGKVVGGPEWSGWVVRWVRGYDELGDSTFTLQCSLPRPPHRQGCHKGFLSHLNIQHTYKWVSEPEKTVAYGGTRYVLMRTQRTRTSSPLQAGHSLTSLQEGEWASVRCIGKPLI